MKKIFAFIVCFPKIVLGSLFLLTCFFGYFSTKLQIDASPESLMLQNDRGLEIWRQVSERYKTPNFLVVAFSPQNGDLFSPSSLDKIAQISSSMSELDFVDSITSMRNVPLLENGKFSLSELAKHIPSLEDSDVNITSAKLEFSTSPLYKGTLVSSDLKTTAILINLKPDFKYLELLKDRNALLREEIKDERLSEVQARLKEHRDSQRDKEHTQITKIREILDLHRGGDELFLGGLNMISDDMVSFVKSDLMSYGTATLALLVFCLWLFFRQIRFVVLPALICFVSVIFAAGLFGLLGFEITVISSNFVALQLIITVSVVIHLVVGYREKTLLRHSWSQRQLVYATLKERFKPCFYAIFTTVIGFISLSSCDIKPVIMLGIMMSVAIVFSLMVAFVIFGSSMMLLKKILSKRNFENSFKFTLWCANCAISRRKFVYIICTFCVALGIIGMSKLRIENSFVGYFKSQTEIYKGMEVVDKKLGGTVPFDVVIKFKETTKKTEASDDMLDSFESEFNAKDSEARYWFNSSRMRVAKKVGNFLRQQQFVGSVFGIDMLLEVGKKLNDGVLLDDFMLSVLYGELPPKYKEMILDPYVNIEHNELHFYVRMQDSDKNLRRDEFLKRIKTELDELLKDDGATVEISGIMTLYNNVLQSLISSQINSFAFVIAALFITFIFVFKSIKLALIAIATNLAPLSMVFGVMGFFGIPLDIMSVTIASISIGIGVDDIIHYIHRYKLELRTKSVTEAIIASHSSIGYAMYYTSFAIFLGFSVMSFSNFWPTIYFGVLTDLVMALMLMAALVLLPSLILTFMKKSEFSENRAVNSNS